MKSYWIIGAGKFGIKAVQAVYKKDIEADITLVDENKKALCALSGISCDFVCMDGVTFLEKNLSDSDYPDWIIPVIPAHLAYEWILKKLYSRYIIGFLSVPESIIKDLPNPIKGKNNEVYLSYADFICPDNCPEPLELCTYTGKPRRGILHKRLEEIGDSNYMPVVVRSRQISPGIGGYRPCDLFGALRKVEKADLPVLFSTACRCHGVMNSFKAIHKCCVG